MWGGGGVRWVGGHYRSGFFFDARRSERRVEVVGWRRRGGRGENEEESEQRGRAEGVEMKEGEREGGREGEKEGGLSVGMNSLRLCGARFPRPPPGPFDK